MSFYIKILLMLGFVSLSHKASAQLDTLNYLKQFEANKAQYINQPFSYLLSQMIQIQPKSHWGDSPLKNKTIVNASSFKFCEIDYSFKNAVTLHIIWKDTFPKSEVKYLQTKNDYYFTDEEKAFYGSKIVKDIIVYR